MKNRGVRWQMGEGAEKMQIPQAREDVAAIDAMLIPWVCTFDCCAELDDLAMTASSHIGVAEQLKPR
jgi:hypothetical protein